MTDIVNHPPHYQGKNLEAIDVIEAFELGYHLGNAVKYVLRAGRKDAIVQELRKARWYIDRKIASLLHTRAAPDHPRNYSLCYLSTPYSNYRGGDIEQAFRDAAALAARLLCDGIAVYSPIVHSHPLALCGGLDPLDRVFWLGADEPMMDAADCLLVAHLDGWQSSEGIRAEVANFAAAGKPVFDIDPTTLACVIRSESP